MDDNEKNKVDNNERNKMDDNEKYKMDDNETNKMDDNENVPQKSSQKVKYFPIRYLFSILAFLGVCNVYIMRSNLNIAIVSMTITPNTSEPDSDEIACPELLPDPDTNRKPERKGGKFDWDSQVQGHALGAVSFGNVITPLPFSLIALKYGAKWVLGLSILVAGVLTLLTPVISEWSVWGLFGLRLAVGLSLAIAFPSMHTLVGKWMPKNERSRHNAFIFNGIPMGTILVYTISGYLVKHEVLGGWPSIFYFSGLAASVWFIFWTLLISERPMENFLISKAELREVEATLEFEPKVRRGPVPWKQILTSIRMYALILTHFGNNWGFYTLLTSMPTYLARVLHFDIESNGLVSSLPYIAYILLSLVAAFTADDFRKRGYRITTIRKIVNSLAYYIPALCLVTIPLIGCRVVPIVVLLSLSTGFNGFKYSGFLATFVDMSPEFAGVAYSISNTIGQLAGFLAPAYNGWVIKTGNTLENWAIVYYTSAGIFFAAGTVFNIFASAELQHWGRSIPTEEGKKSAESQEGKGEESAESLEEKEKGSAESLEVTPNFRSHDG